MILNIEPYELKLICETLEIRVIDSGKETFTIFYCLRRADGYIAEQGNKVIPIEALPLLAIRPLNIQAINQVLTSWNITAIGEVEDNVEE